MNKGYDFSGWATKNDILCSDGRTIRKDAFKDNDGKTVPLVWNHSHNDPNNVLGHCVLENRDEGVYTYGTFNDTEQGKNAKSLVEHGDVTALSIWANKLKQNRGDVLHGDIKEVSLVLAGANIGACIDSVIRHGEESDEEAVIYSGEDIVLAHADTTTKSENKEEKKPMADTNANEKTVKDVFDTLNEEQKKVVYALIGQALESNGAEDDEEEPEGGKEMKHNVFEQDDMYSDDVLSHADEEAIIGLAKSNSVGSLQEAISMFAEENHLAHGIDDIVSLFPEYKDVRPGAPEMITRDFSWVDTVINGVHKSPISRIRTRQADARIDNLRALGYKKGAQKKNTANIKLLKRTTDPQTIYIKDTMHRDDIIDITDFDVVEYQYGLMKNTLKEEIAMAIMVGDGREEGDENKISETHIRPIWTDDELYTLHYDVDLTKARAELQGTNTGANFGENYVYAEAIITAALYSREKYKGSGTPAFYCTPHLLNVMLLARDLNGRRIYSSVSDLKAALNVSAIHTVEQFEGKVRTTTEGSKKKKLLGIFVNLADYQVGSTKGGEITRFNQFDIDFNQQKYLIETRLSGALTRVFSAIALEEPVSEPSSSAVSEETGF